MKVHIHAPKIEFFRDYTLKMESSLIVISTEHFLV